MSDDNWETILNENEIILMSLNKLIIKFNVVLHIAMLCFSISYSVSRL